VSRPPLGVGATAFVAGHGYARRFPVDLLPATMRDYANDLAERKQVPVDLTALTMLGIMSGIAGPRIVVRRDHDFTEPTNLYVLTGMDSGSAKSPAVTELRKGLWKATQTIREAHEATVRQQQQELDVEIERCLTRANDITVPLDEKTGLRTRAKDLQKEAELLAQKPPRPPVLALDGDTTPEALTDRMAANGCGGSVIDDEGTLLRNLGGQYSGKTANLAVLLKAYDCLPYYPSRATRETGEMERAALSITISPQPRLVADMLRNTMMEDTGLINRFLLSLPGDLVGKRQGRPSTFIDDEPERQDAHLKTWWADLLDSLVRYDVISVGSIEDETSVIDLTREAWKLHYDFQEAFEPRMDGSRGGDLARVRGWASKHCGRVLRIAALLHLAAGWTTDDRIDEKTMRSAILIGDWALEHFLHVGKVVGLSEGAGRIKEFIDGRELKFASRSEINVEVFRKNVTSDQLTTWIVELIETGEYEHARLPTSGRPKTVVRKIGAKAREAHAA
jgi:replicative DNA helicase